jgi:hypothetical protein
VRRSWRRRVARTRQTQPTLASGLFIPETQAVVGTRDAPSREVREFAAVAAIVLTTLACQVRSVTAPAGLPQVSDKSVTLTVQVLTRGAEQPIAGASVRENDTIVEETDATGVARITVPYGVDLQISVTAPGYEGFGASGTVTTPERWRFYLAPQHVSSDD